MQKKRKGYESKSQVKSRQEYVDYDYVDKLTEEEKRYLGKFTDEFYGATWDINPSYVLYNELPSEELKLKVRGNKRIRTDLGFLIQVTKNPDRKQNVDLRKIKMIDIFYKVGEYIYTTDTQYKYADTNVHDPQKDEHRLACVERVRLNRKDLSSLTYLEYLPKTDEDVDFILDKYDNHALSPEELLLRAESEIHEEMLKEAIYGVDGGKKRP